MSETQGITTQQFHSCHIKGESVPLWVPSVMALLGIINSIFIAQSLLPTRLQIADLPTVQNKAREQPRITKQLRTEGSSAVSRAGTSSRKNALPRLQEQLSKNGNQHQRPPSLVEKNAALAKAPTTAKAIPGNAKAKPVRQLTANLPAQRTVSPATPSKEKQTPAIATAETHGSISGNPIQVAANVAKKPAAAVGTTFPQASEITESRTSQPPASGTDKAAAMSPQAAPTEKITSVTTQHAAMTRHPSHPRDCPALFFISFPIGSETPRMQNLSPKIRRLQSWLKQHPGKKVIIEGHTDSYGPEEFNLLLSYRRAKAAEGILLEAGIPGNQLLVRALGEEEPVPGLPAKSRKNRVASIRVETPQGCINNFINGDIN